jgi:hypothetical protein
MQFFEFMFRDGFTFVGCFLLMFLAGFYVSRALNNLIKITFNFNKFTKFTDEEANAFIKAQAKATMKGEAGPVAEKIADADNKQ